MSATKRELYAYLMQLGRTYEGILAERAFLQTGVPARLALLNTERAEIASEAQEQLDRLNTLRVADGESPLTLQRILELSR